MSEGASPGVRLTVELFLDSQLNEWRWVVAERLDEDPGEGPGITLWGDRWIAGGAMPTLDRVLSAINTAIIRRVAP